jgi:hypothetical protein
VIAKLVSFVTYNGLYIGQTNSPIGRKAIIWSLRFSIPLESLLNVRLKCDWLRHRFINRWIPEKVVHAGLLQMLLITDSYLPPNSRLQLDEIASLIYHLTNII